MLPWARDHETGVIVYSPMASGLLTGAFTAARAASLDPGDWRRGDPDFTGPALTANLALAEAPLPALRKPLPALREPRSPRVHYGASGPRALPRAAN